MKVYSDTLSKEDLREAATVAGVWVWEIEAMKRPRKRAHGWHVFLTGSSPYRSQATGVAAATWDEHGAWMAELNKRDPRLLVAYYRDLPHFLSETRAFAQSPYNREQPERKRKRAPWLSDSDLLKLA